MNQEHPDYRIIIEIKDGEIIGIDRTGLNAAVETIELYLRKAITFLYER